jgi:hypothetical protein
MYPHRIRLRGPWECVPLQCNDDRPVPDPVRLTMPCRWGVALPGFAGKVRFLRRFGYPGTIDETERVWLTFGGCAGQGIAAVNGVELGEIGDGGAEFDVTRWLRPRNELCVEITGPVDGGLWGEVALEVRRTAFLRNVRLWYEGKYVQATGEVVGEGEGLELYLVVDRYTLAHQVLGRFASDGHPFALSTETEQLEADSIGKVDLVGGAIVWYTVEQRLTPQ